MAVTLVVGFDRRPESMAAVFAASDLAESVGGELRIVHAVDLRDYPVDPESPDWEEKASRVLEHERRAIEEVMAGREILWSYHVHRVDAYSALVAEAKQGHASMIVVGSRGGGVSAKLRRMMFGSVSHRLISHGGYPVLVVGPGPGASPNRL